MYVRNTRSGFVALTSTIIIGAVLIVLAVSLASSGFFGRFVVFDAEVKEVSRGLAEGCVDTALLEFVQRGDDYVAEVFPQTEFIGSRSCEVNSVSHPGSIVRIRARAVFQGAVTNLEAEFDDTDPFAVVSWVEVAEF